ncbi:thioredoxin domain-containing protein [Sphingomonas sp. H39-1-10]|uniref:DsbA family protein n=1 Tax=Sphingomonas pollutisoli TaxID=3030829 RepID=UPI0023B9FBDA|nr:thioredoxin domain-containing protein [Sphingomonas pollutisoli]MDF0486761.1 thioredoxin domain-containing protein [Sphingomonas pollutisoli]
MTMRLSVAIVAAITLAACKPAADTGGSGATSAPVAAKPAPAGQSWVDTVAKTDDGGYRMGNPDAPVKLIEYGSRTCPHCGVFDAEGLPKLKAGPIAAGKLSYEFHDYPVHNQLDLGPILLGQCVEPAQFFPMLDQMFANQESLIYRKDQIPAADQAKLNTATPTEVISYLANFYGYLDFVKQRGVPEAKAKACLADGKALEAIAKQTDAANQKYNITGTPTFIVNGKVVPNAAAYEQLEPALKAAGAL